MAAKKRPSAKESNPGKPASGKRVYVSAENMPRKTLEEAILIARKLHEIYAGKSASRDELASAIGSAVNTPKTHYLLSSAVAYGIVIDEGDNKYALSELGRKIVAPTYEGEDQEALVKAIMTPATLSKFYSDYNGHPIPAQQHLANLLETRYSIPRERTAEAIEIIRANGKFAGILDESHGAETPVVQLGGGFAEKVSSASEEAISGASEGGSIEGVHAAETTEWSKICFYITPIGDDGSDIRKHADLMLRHVLAPVFEQFQMKVIRADQIAKSGLISQQIFEHLAKARLCVADLSFSNPNAFYELGVRHVCRLPTIQVIQKGDKIPFDVLQGRTITVDLSDRYTLIDRIESAKRELAEHIKNALAGKEDGQESGNPVAVYLPDLKVNLPK
jgi:hypothetical protein